MWEDPVEATVLWQVVVDALPLAALRVLAWLLVGFAVTLAGGLVGVIASLSLDTRHPGTWSVMR